MLPIKLMQQTCSEYDNDNKNEAILKYAVIEMSQHFKKFILFCLFNNCKSPLYTVQEVSLIENYIKLTKYPFLEQCDGTDL